MNFSGTFLNSTVAKRIAWMLLLAVFIPTALITGLADRTINKILVNHDKKDLIEISQNYGLDAFSNLIFARSTLEQIAMISEKSNLNPAELHQSMFKSMVVFSEQETKKTLFGTANYDIASLEKIINAQQKSTIFVRRSLKNNAPPAVLISIKKNQKYLVGELSPNYLWGELSDYPTDINFCAYSNLDNVDNQDNDNKQENQMLFCSGAAFDAAKVQKLESENNHKIGHWALFLRAEFQHAPWNIVTYRYGTKKMAFESLMNNNSFISIAILSLLVVALMGLIHIRKTMVPLEKLMEGTRSIAKGEFNEVVVKDDSEFSKLADSFNGMSIHIQRQLNTLKNLAEIDRNMATKLDVDDLIAHIILRIETLIPQSTVAIFRMNEITERLQNIESLENKETEVQCSIDISNHASLNFSRISIPHQEYQKIQALSGGEFGFCNHTKMDCYEKKLSNVGATHRWVYPIVWQGEMCAFVGIGKASPFDENAFYWDEVRELCNRIAIAISAQAREDKLRTQAQYDSLTGLPNRILLQDRLHQAMEHSDHTGQAFWLAFIDLDRFKFVNDSLGHKAGDQLLMEVSQRLSAVVQDTDTIARFGGDEFIIILQGQSDTHLRMDVLNKLIEAGESPIFIEGKEIFISASIGISVYPTDAQDADGLLRNADVAMYRAKEMGKNNFQFFTQSMNKRVTDRLSMETHLRKALELNEFKLLYQPKVNLKTQKIVGMEALIRWHSEALGFVSPQQFIPLAEENGMIIQIGEWALKTACAQTKAWQLAGFDDLLISVNLSARQFKHKDLVNSIAVILKETGLAPNSLELELTEGLIMSGVEDSMKILHGIKSIGVHLSVDDFGTGYSSLAYLKNLPLDTLKIDKSFTDDIINHTDKVPIVASVILLAKNLGLKVVAEGVENIEQVKYLTAHQCDEIQGYYFSKPESTESFQEMLKANKQLT